MKAINNKRKPVNSMAAGLPFTKEELLTIIKEAEKGPFISGEELKKKMNKWIKESEK